MKVSPFALSVPLQQCTVGRFAMHLTIRNEARNHLISLGNVPFHLWFSFSFQFLDSHSVNAISILDSLLQNGCCYFSPFRFQLLHNVFGFVMDSSPIKYICAMQIMNISCFFAIFESNPAAQPTVFNNIQQRTRKSVEKETKNVFGKIEFSVAMIGKCIYVYTNGNLAPNAHHIHYLRYDTIRCVVFLPIW